MKNLAVTVLIDTYNHECFIEEAIVSVLEQDFPAADMEILVVDDGSTDRTPQIVHKFAPRVRYLHKANGGQASAFNFGIPLAQGEIVAFLDGDDWWKKEKLVIVAGAFEKNPNAGTVGHGIVEVDTSDGRSRALAPGTTGYFDLSSDAGAQIFRNFMAFLGTSRVSIRKKILGEILPFPQALIVEADELMSALAIARGGAVLLSEMLTFYRLHDENLYQFRQDDPVRARRKMAVLDCLVNELPPRLRDVGVTPSAVSIIVDPICVSSSRMRLAMDGGMPWETYRLEKANFKLSYQHVSAGYRVYKQLSLLLALVLPPRLYYDLLRFYAAGDLRRFRSWLGEPTPKADVREVQLNTGAGSNGGK
jgi:glycosyltransferase involved in cell wall biosynthesis